MTTQDFVQIERPLTTLKYVVLIVATACLHHLVAPRGGETGDDTGDDTTSLALFQISLCVVVLFRF